MAPVLKKILIHAPSATAHCNDYLAYLYPSLSSYEVVVVEDDFPRRSAWLELSDIARRNNCDVVLSLIGEKLLSYTLCMYRLSPSFRRGPIFIAFYFLYHNLFSLSCKSLLLSLLIRLSPIRKLLISDPALIAGSRFAHSLIKDSLAYVCDPCSLAASSSSQSRSQFRKEFGIDKNSIVIACVGLLTRKKAISLLVDALDSVDLDCLKPICFLFAGKVESELFSACGDSLQRLAARGLIVRHFRYLDDSELASVLYYADASWCVQDSFSGSSGIFSKTCFAGNIPIVASGTTIGRICSSFGFGYCINIHRMPESIYGLCNFLSGIDYETRKKLSCRARSYALLNSPGLFADQVVSVLESLNSAPVS